MEQKEKKIKTKIDEKLVDLVLKTNMSKTQKNMLKVMRHLQNNPFANLREISKATGICKSTVSDIIRIIRQTINTRLEYEKP